jgi:zinc transport system ATP-binding protein
VLLANALDPLPELLILDEPSSGLDERSARWLDDTLQTFKGEMTTLMVSHDVEQVRRVADRVSRLRATDADRFGAAGPRTNDPTNPTNP